MSEDKMKNNKVVGIDTYDDDVVAMVVVQKVGDIFYVLKSERFISSDVIKRRKFIEDIKTKYQTSIILES